MSARARALIIELGLEPHPEGGHFRELFRSERRVTAAGLDRSAATTIYFLLRAGEISRWHVVGSDEVWHFYEGEGLDLFTYDPASGRIDTVTLGSLSDQSTAVPVHVVPAGRWQAASPRGAYALVGCTVAPGFEFADFQFVADRPDAQTAFDGPLRWYVNLR